MSLPDDIPAVVTFVTFLTPVFDIRFSVFGHKPYNQIISLRAQQRFAFLKFQTDNRLKYSYFLDIVFRLWKI